MKTNETEQPFSTFDDTMGYLTRFTNYERMRSVAYTREALDLDRIRVVLQELGNPQNDAPIFHIAGTKGKGSTCAIMSAILQEAGYRVGVFSQPHLVRINERITINNVEISDSDWIECLNRQHPHLERLRLAETPLTFFDIITVMSIVYFSEQNVDFMILEVGLGGRLDSTNVVTPIVSVITSIDYDHTNILGETLEEIAREKAGIIKESVPTVSGVEQDAPANEIRRIAAGLSASLYEVDAINDLQLNLLGEHQKRNAAVAIKALRVVRDVNHLILSEENVKSGLMKIQLRGRCEILHENPVLILDGAHNPSSMRALRETISSQYESKKIHLLIAMTDDKEIAKSLAEILPIASKAIFTVTGFQKSSDPNELVKIARSLEIDSDIEIIVEPEIQLAYKLLINGLNEETLGCATGSFYLAGEVAKLYADVGICK